jgi:hypothetical protein
LLFAVYCLLFAVCCLIDRASFVESSVIARRIIVNPEKQFSAKELWRTWVLRQADRRRADQLRTLAPFRKGG